MLVFIGLSLCYNCLKFSSIHFPPKFLQMPQPHYILARSLKSWPSFVVSMMLPLTFSFPFMNSCCGSAFPIAIETKSSSSTVILQSGFPCLHGPTVTEPDPVLRSTIHWPTVFPPFVTFHSKIPLTFLTRSGWSATRLAISVKRASLFRSDLPGGDTSAFTSY